jgi:uncharacterized 2Fe-2S/4Fe-4S cluster protein (DUF4445 family)
MGKLKVTFLPFDKSLEVDEGTTIAEAAQRAGVYINNLCGGEGVCGECRVRVLTGEARQDENAASFFSNEELEQGYALACQTKIQDELCIEIPVESRLDDEQIMTGEAKKSVVQGDDLAVREETGPTVYPLKPILRKVFLELPEPTLEDNITDIERVARELRRKIGWHSYEISFECLLNLSDLLRDHNWRVTVSVVKDGKGYRIQKIEPGNTTSKHYGVAVDVGTTTVVTQLVDLRTGRVLGVDGTHNMQAQYGEDVISRIIFACRKDGAGLPQLQDAVISNINDLIESLAAKENIKREDIYAIIASGNTTMSHLLLGLVPCSIRLEPYVPTADVYPQILASDVGIQIHPRGILNTVPSVSSYVGGDIVAGVISSGIADQENIQGLIDIGTNGEIAIGCSEWLVCCSASAGPSFEGGGTRCGMRATRGAIENVEIKDGKVIYETIGNASPRGICGSGLIDCIYELVRNRIIGYGGKFDRKREDPLLTSEDGIPQYVIATADESESGEPLVITESDIDNLMKSKGSVFAAIKSLVDYTGLTFDMLDTFYVAGGFGSFLNIRKAIAIGLLPDIPEDRIRFIGNSSLTGSRMALIHEEVFKKSLAVSRSMTNIELSNYQPYMDEYVASLFLPHTNRKLFPTVDY